MSDVPNHYVTVIINSPQGEVDSCRYCGIEPGQDFPRPSYHDVRAENEAFRRALRTIASEDYRGNRPPAQSVAQDALDEATP